MQVIRFNGQTPTPSTFKLCNLGDNKWEKIEFHVPRYAGMNATLHLSIGEYSDVVELSSDGVYTVQRKHTQQAGTILGYITIVADEDIVWHSDEFKMIVGEVRDDGPEIADAYPSAFENALKTLDEIKGIKEKVDGVAEEIETSADQIKSDAEDAAQSKAEAEQYADEVKQIVEQFVGGVLDHSKLTNRDVPDQHTIGAITGLTAKLANVDSRYMTSEEILMIMK